MTWEYFIGGATVIGALFTVLSFFKKSVAVQSKVSKDTRILSLGVEHSYSPVNLENFDRQKVQLSIFNTGSQRCSIKKIDWHISGTPKRSSVKVSFDFPFLVPDEGVLIEHPINEVLVPQLNFESQSVIAKLEILKNLELEVELMTHNESFSLPIPSSLKLALFRQYSSNKFLTWVFKRWI